MPKVTLKIAEFIKETTYEDLPQKNIPFIVDAITDSIGVAYAGTSEKLADILLNTIQSDENAFESFLIGTNRKASLTDAALYNGSLIHALDYDDISHPAYTHPSSHLLPVLISLGQRYQSSGKDIVTAYAIGIEIEGKLGRVMNMDHYAKGWHATSTLGTLAAAASGAKIMDLSVDEIRTALGIAASQVSGLRSNFGTMTKPFHAGMASKNGVLACQLAKQGFTANRDIFETKHGFLQVFSGDSPEFSHFDDLGNPYEIETEYCISIKPFPSCGATHTSIEATLNLVKKHEITADMVKDVRVGVNRHTPNILVYNQPKTPMEGKFSMEFCIAAAIMHQKVNLDTFIEEVIQSEEFQRLISAIRSEVDERVIDNSEFGAVVKIRLKDGREFEELVELSKGKPAKWLSKEELYDKFTECLTYGGYNDQRLAKQLFDRWQSIEQEQDINNLLKIMY